MTPHRRVPLCKCPNFQNGKAVVVYSIQSQFIIFPMPKASSRRGVASSPLQPCGPSWADSVAPLCRRRGQGSVGWYLAHSPVVRRDEARARIQSSELFSAEQGPAMQRTGKEPCAGQLAPEGWLGPRNTGPPASAYGPNSPPGGGGSKLGTEPSLAIVCKAALNTCPNNRCPFLASR